MQDHPYAPPNAPIVEGLKATIPVYSPMQAVVGAMIGGPVGVVYFLWANFRALGKHDAALNTLWLGVLGIALVIGSIFVLPEDFPSTPFTVVYVLTAHTVASKYQMSKAAIAVSKQFGFQSNGRVFGMSCLSLLASVVILLGAGAIAVWQGFIT